MKSLIPALALSLALALAPGCSTFAPFNAGPPTAWETAASDFALAYVDYKAADTSEQKAESLEKMAALVVSASGLLGADIVLDDVVPSPGLIVLLAEAFPDANSGQIALYAKVITLLLRPGSDPSDAAPPEA